MGDYARGGKPRTDRNGKVEQGWDHDPPATENLVPFGILMLASGALTLIFGSRETSADWVDALKRLHGDFPDGIRVPRKDMKQYEARLQGPTARLQRSPTLPIYDIVIH